MALKRTLPSWSGNSIRKLPRQDSHPWQTCRIIVRQDRAPRETTSLQNPHMAPKIRSTLSRKKIDQEAFWDKVIADLIKFRGSLRWRRKVNTQQLRTIRMDVHRRTRSTNQSNKPQIRNNLNLDFPKFNRGVNPKLCRNSRQISAWPAPTPNISKAVTKLDPQEMHLKKEVTAGMHL